MKQLLLLRSKRPGTSSNDRRGDREFQKVWSSHTIALGRITACSERGKVHKFEFWTLQSEPKIKIGMPDPPYLCTALFGEGLGNVEIFASIIKLWSIYSRTLAHNLLVWAGACSLFLRVSTEFHTIIYTIHQNITFLKFHDNINITIAIHTLSN